MIQSIVGFSRRRFPIRPHVRVGVALVTIMACGKAAQSAPLTPERGHSSAQVESGVSSEGLLFRLVSKSRQNHCAPIQRGWFAIRGNWWVAVDSVPACPARGAIGQPLGGALVAEVDSGVLMGGGTPPNDTLFLQSSVAPAVLPQWPSVVGIRRADSLLVRSRGGGYENTYRLVRR
jgi:hypothetical protein